ncbi:putative uncharacterized protein [Burkholderiales bacterium GJ-E10]|nr:putative uncharacterized protein [Burkholderiales bacterium GJ-E10]
MGGSSAMKGMMQRMMGGSLPPGIDPALLPESGSRGAQALQRYCVQCHNLPGPGLHTAAEWPAVLARMNARMQMMQGMPMMQGMMHLEAPTPTEQAALLEYLQKYATRPIDRSAYPDLHEPAGRSFSSVCSQCHALPDPRQHTARQWPKVVERMKRNMLAMGKSVPGDAETKAITEFLQRHARAEN